MTPIRCVFGAVLVLGACGRAPTPSATRSGTGPRAEPPSIAAAPSATHEAAPLPSPPPAAAEPARGPFALHEWGLVATVAGGTDAVAGTGVIRPIARTPPGMGIGIGAGGSYGYGGKPVLYVHLDEGVERATFSLDVALPSRAHFDEHWPPAALDGTTLRFADVVATRGACAVRTAPPSGRSAACRTADHFCEAAEIPRYEADHEVCLAVGESTTDLLFYRASGLDVAGLPLTLTGAESALQLARGAGPMPSGPVFYLSKEGRQVHIRRLAVDVAPGPVAGLTGAELSVDETRAALLAEAVARGLTPAEAEAFVDAWAPAYFDHCRRPGPEAHGHAPDALSQANRSLLYFAPPELVDAMVPLHATPTPRATSRVFLVRVIDARSIPEPAVTVAAYQGYPPYGIGPGSSYAPGDLRPFARIGDTISVQGGLSEAVIRRIAQRHLGEVRHCYEQGLQRNPGMVGRVTVSFIIVPTGPVGGSSVADNSLGDSTVGSCVAAAVRRWTFPVPRPAGPVSVRLPFLFSQTGG